MALEEKCVDKDIELRPDGKEKKGEAKAALIKVLEKHEADFKAIIEGQEANLEGLGKVQSETLRHVFNSKIKESLTWGPVAMVAYYVNYRFFMPPTPPTPPTPVS